MPTDLALADLLRPYVLRGEHTDWHAALSTIYVESFETAQSTDGIVIRGIARFSGTGAISFDPISGKLSMDASNTEGHPRNQAGRRDPWLDITDTRVEFSMSAPRAAGAIVASGVATIPANDSNFAPVQDVLEAWDSIPNDAAPSDYPGTGVTLDLVLSGIVLRPPFLKPAKMELDGLLVADPAFRDVVFNLPRIKLRLSQDSGLNAVLDASIASLGVSGIDDPGDIAAAEMISMTPPYAFIGEGNVVGFGFRSAVLDLADGYTPPAVLDQFGFDESWTGLYLPEIRLFVAPHGMEDFAVNAGVRNFLLGLGQSSGVTFDFEGMVINQGAGALQVSVAFVDNTGRVIGVTRLSDTTAEVALPERTRMLIEVVGGRAPYTGQATFAGMTRQGVVHDIDLSTTTELTIGVDVTDTSAVQKNASLTIQARRRQSTQSLPVPGTGSAIVQPATVKTTAITLEGKAQPSPELLLVRQDNQSATISLNPPSPNTAWTVAGNAVSSGATVTVPVAAGETKTLTATRSSGNINDITCYFRFDQPDSTMPSGFASDPDNINSSPAVDPSGSAFWLPPGTPFMEHYRQALKQISAATTLTLTGSASYEQNEAKSKYNYLLSRRRAEALRQLLQAEANHPDSAKRIPNFNLNVEPADIGAAAPDAAWASAWKTHSSPRNTWWKATVSGFGPITLPGSVTNGEVSRPNSTQIPVPPPPPPPQPPVPQPPDWFRSIALKIRIVRDQFVAIELSGEVDFQTGAEERLRNRGVAQSEIPQFEGLGSQNPADGIVKYKILYQTDAASQTDQVKLYLGADPNDRDGLFLIGQLPGQPLKPRSTGLNVLGMTALFTPLIAETAPASPTDGSVSEIVLTAAALGLPIALAELGWLNVERVVLYGGELNVTTRAGQWVSTLLFDVETAISANINIGALRILEIPRENPLVVRYKAIGLKMGYPPGSSERFQFRPMFDASKGYSIDLSGPGAVRVPDPLGQILQVLGARIARTNPLTFEVDLGFAVDLGVVTIERARVRMPVAPVGVPELTAFAASINVPGTVEGRGYMEINGNEIKGQIDISLVPLKLRLSAGLGVANIPASEGGPATGVIITLELELPVAIPLAQSGFGIYGFLGLFAMHYARDESGINSLTPALTWLKERAEGNPTNIKAWKPQVNKWAFGLGAILGTMEGGIIFNVKGMVLLELPGPRLMLVVRANLLAVLPDLKEKNAEGTFLCVIDIDFGRGTLSIGLSIDFGIKPIVQIQIPVEAYFNLKEGSDWHIYLGTFTGSDIKGRPLPGPIHANIMQVFDGTGYVMVSGHGIPAYKGLSAVNGVGLAVGLQVAITWGSQDINLYLRATAGFNAVLGFEPFYVGGLLYVRGELHLFVVSISASAELKVQIGELADGTEVSRIDGEVCGEVDLFFFTIKGCVDFHLGENSAIVPIAPDLVRSVTLVSRSPALVVGTGVDRGIDAKIGDALKQPAPPALNAKKLVTVPIDAIPVITMSATPFDEGLLVMGEGPQGTPGAPADGFIKRGDYAYRYHLKSVELIRADGGDITGPGPRPSTWWTLNDPIEGNLVAQLSLLNWTPNATPKAVERSEFLENNTEERWGTVCHEAAPAAAILWTFENEPSGPSESGWKVDGIAWPDPANSKRSAVPVLEVKVWERWRSGDRQLDRQRGIIPAAITPALVPCYEAKQADYPALNPYHKISEGSGFSKRLHLEQQALTAATAPSVGLRKMDRGDVDYLDLSDMMQQLASGQAIHRVSLMQITTASEDRKQNAMLITKSRQCNSRLLASPQFDIGLPVVFGDRSRAKEIANSLDRLGKKSDQFSDAIVIASGSVIEGRILLLLHRSLPSDNNQYLGLVVRFFDQHNHEIHRHQVSNDDSLSVVGMPARWNDAGGPWAEPVHHVISHSQRLEKIYGAYLVQFKGMDKLHHIEIALMHESDSPDGRMKYEQSGRPYYVAAFEFTRLEEARREEWDQREVKRNRGVLETFLGPDSGDLALLVPDQLYCLRTSVEVTVKDKDGNESGAAPQTADFWFKTDNLSPKSLEPWMLCSIPSVDEPHYFGEEFIKIVFATQDVDKLWGAYGKELRARLKAASFRQVNVPGLQHPVPLIRQPSNTIQPGLVNIPASVLSPFEGALVDGLAAYGPCIPQDVNRSRHSAITIPIPLDPYTDYVLDIEAVAIGAPQNTVGERVLRRHFSTGAYGTFDDFAASFQGAFTEHRFAPPGAMQGIAATPAFAGRDPQGGELDQAMATASLEPMPVPKSPRIVVFWEQASPAAIPQPVAVLVDAAEPMLRTRMLPQEDISGDAPPTTRWRMLEKTWLNLVADAGNTTNVIRTIWAPGRQRALVMLEANARGKRLQLALRREVFTEPYLDGAAATPTSFVVVDEILGHAPWEEQ
ncbi:hypothetical protein LG201_10215 [Methylobacillus gramineus]|uniref:hypothetical protein n=1 Tax=Methylobacillus gramineus TaxID=755169 RepID=UPI001D00031C|nr:hypothetical protein [Methylobacillus gramineus]MCB5185576.1 hypothetical protein [Methylobacillus gramineus]